MADLRKRAGVPSIPRLLGKRKLGYLGHLARYPASRIEQRVAFGVLEPEGRHPLRRKQGVTLRHQCHSRLQELLAFATEEERAEGWLAVAQRRDRWRELVS
eukprot:8703192-Pyramimonas_sp.AAC.1